MARHHVILEHRLDVVWVILPLDLRRDMYSNVASRFLERDPDVDEPNSPRCFYTTIRTMRRLQTAENLFWQLLLVTPVE